jgi:hypothetical protein
MGTITKIMLAVTIPEATWDRAVSNSASKRRVRTVAGDVKLMYSHSTADLELFNLQGNGSGGLWLPQTKQGPLHFHEYQAFPWIEPLSRTNQPAALFRMSRSIRSLPINEVVSPSPPHFLAQLRLLA